YLYSVSKLQDINDKGEDALESTESTAVSHIDTVVDTVNSMSEKIDHIGNKIDVQDKTDYEDIKGICKDGKADIDKLKSIYDEIKGHPNGWKGGIKKEVVSLSALAAHGLFESGKKELAELVMKIMMKKHIATENLDENQRLIKLNVKDGYEGLDFTGTTLFKDKKTVDIVVSYTIKPITPLPIIPEIRIIQRASVTGWLDGDGSRPKRDQKADNSDQLKNKDQADTLWDLGPFDRGNEIQKRFGANVLNRTGGAVDIFDSNTGMATDIRSIDITLPSYQDINNLKKEIKGEMDALEQYNGKVRVNINGNDKEFSILNKKVRIIVPKGTKTEQIKALEAELNSQYKKVKLTIEEYIEKKVKVL
ncbi:MAG: hypothetical protein Q8942_18510, partial [Bacillota bacterium]|nr:hypothetical protein [Bacillota bacterium]